MRGEKKREQGEERGREVKVGRRKDGREGWREREERW